MNKYAKNLALAICNRTTTRLDMAGLSIDVYGPDLGEMYEFIGRAYLADMITKYPTVGDLLKPYEFEPEKARSTASGEQIIENYNRAVRKSFKKD